MYPTCRNYRIALTVEKNVAIEFGILLYIIFKKLPKVNNRPKGENSPNLVSLVVKIQFNKILKYELM
jgi:hypothetical protein